MVNKSATDGKKQNNARLEYMTATDWERDLAGLCFSCHSLVPVRQVNTVMFLTLYISSSVPHIPRCSAVQTMNVFFSFIFKCDNELQVPWA